MKDLRKQYLKQATGSATTPSSASTDKYAYSGQAEGHHILVAAVEVVNAAGLCLFGYLSYPFQSVLDQLSAATGDAWDMEMQFLSADMRKIKTV